MQMVKGAQRRMVQVRMGNSRYFEEALFIVRRDLPRQKAGEDEMLAEANRILRESLHGEGKRKRRLPAGLFWLLGGVLLGLGAALLVFFLRAST